MKVRISLLLVAALLLAASTAFAVTGLKMWLQETDQILRVRCDSSAAPIPDNPLPGDPTKGMCWLYRDQTGNGPDVPCTNLDWWTNTYVPGSIIRLSISSGGDTLAPAYTGTCNSTKTGMFNANRDPMDVSYAPYPGGYRSSRIFYTCTNYNAPRVLTFFAVFTYTEAAGNMVVYVSNDWTAINDNATHIYELSYLCCLSRCANEVSGVWDMSGSPYHINCTMNVPAGQTLVIQPGVQVLIGRNCTISVHGTLQAVGTEQDSIEFAFDHMSPSYFWEGIRFYGGSDDSSRLEYCTIEGVRNPYNGTIDCDSASPTISHCTIRNNVAMNGGGVACKSASPLIAHCCFYGDTAQSSGGGIYADSNSSPSIVGCTISGNRANGAGGAVGCYNSMLSMRDCIVWGNSAPVSSALGDSGSAIDVQFTDFQGSYSGTGNINENPLFVDATNGDYRLQCNSPCIDSGDPTSPLDADGSQADMGAFPSFGPKLSLLSPNGGEQWRTFQYDTVHWSGSRLAQIRVELNCHYPTGTWEVLATSANNDGWEAIFVTDPPSDSCRIRVSSMDGACRDTSYADFRIMSSQGYLALALQSQPAIPMISWDGGTVECPETTAVAYNFKNFGNETVTLFLPTLVAGTQFHQTNDCQWPLILAPGEMSACSATLSFVPQSETVHRDTLLILSNAINAVNGHVRIPLLGRQIRTPADPQIAIFTDTEDAHLSWQPVTLSIGNCPITVTRYLVFYSPTFDGPYYYHGYTAGTNYTHYGVVIYANGMFYQVYARTGSTALLDQLPTGGVLTRKEVLKRLGEE